MKPDLGLRREEEKEKDREQFVIVPEEADNVESACIHCHFLTSVGEYSL